MEFVAKAVDWHACANRDCEKVFFLVRPHHGCTYIRERIKFHSKQKFITLFKRNRYTLKCFKHYFYFLSLLHVNREIIKTNSRIDY